MLRPISQRATSIPLPKFVRWKHRGTVAICLCPICDDASGHLEWDMVRRIWFCYKHWAGGAAPWRSTAMKITPGMISRCGATRSVTPCRLPPTASQLAYLQSRGLTDGQIADLNPVNLIPAFVSIPIYDRVRKLIGHVHRRMTNDEPRYLNAVGLWGIHRWSGSRMVLVEGPLDAAGYPDRVAVMGSRLTGDQLLIIGAACPDEVVVMFDADATTKANHVCRTLSHRILGTVRMAQMTEHKDPLLAGPAVCAGLIDNATRFT